MAKGAPAVVKHSRWSLLQPTVASSGETRMLGRLPESAMLLILSYATLPDVRSLCLTSRRLNILAKDDAVWTAKLHLLDFDVKKPQAIQANGQTAASQAGSSRTSISKEPKKQDVLFTAAEDDFGDFVTTPTANAGSFNLFDDHAQKAKPLNDLLSFDDDGGEDIGIHKAEDLKRSATPKPTANLAGESARETFIKAYTTLIPYYLSLQIHTTSSLLFTQTSLSQLNRARLLSSLTKLLIQSVAPTRSNTTLNIYKRNLESATDFFEGAILAEFEKADIRNDLEAMKRCASVAWALPTTATTSTNALHSITGASNKNIVQVFVNRREIFYDQSHNPLKNLVKVANPDSNTGEMVDGIDFAAMDKYMAFVLDVVKKEGEVIAKVFPKDSGVLLDFAERIAVDVISEYITPLLSAAQSLTNPLFLLATAATFAQVSRLVPCLLAIEPEAKLITKHQAEDVVFRMFEIHMDDYLQEEQDWVRSQLEEACKEFNDKLAKDDPSLSAGTFLNSANPAAVKRNVMASFGKALLMPVTIVPKTVAYSFTAVTAGTFSAVQSLGGLVGVGQASPAATMKVIPASVDEEVVEFDQENGWSNKPNRISLEAQVPAGKAPSDQFASLQLLLSLDVALQLISADRNVLKRVQTFAGYPGSYGTKVRDTIEEVFIVLLQTLSERHVVPGFQKAISQMASYQPAEHEEERNVAPLVQFFELVHIGDTIGQMIQVFYEKEMASFIDRTDFLNIVVREKKRFEGALDDSVASGLNTGVQLLMTQAEHLLVTKQSPIDYCPNDIASMDLQPTPACVAVVQCLKTHCDMLKGNTDKQILEVFYVEIGLRLHGIILKHLKRSMISPDGGLQVISDINAYHAFIVSLRQATITPYFTALKMICNLYIVEKPKDLAALVKDVQRYEGTMRSEDAYELLQRRTDWRLKEKEVDKALYGLSTEDCRIM